MALVVLLAGRPSGAGEAETAGRVKALAWEYKTEIKTGDPAQALGVALGKAAETWAAVAESLSRRLAVPEAEDFLARVRGEYERRLNRAQGPAGVQLAGLNLLYQALNTSATLLARHFQDQAAQEQIVAAEERVLRVFARVQEGGPALAALSGGAMTMLALMAKSLDRQGLMAPTLEGEFSRRRTIDANISRRQDLGPTERFSLLFYNHLHGAFSMVEIIGLILDPDLKSPLRDIEKRLIQAGQEDLQAQIVAGAKALAEAGFLVGPALAQALPAPEAGAGSEDPDKTSSQ